MNFYSCVIDRQMRVYDQFNEPDRISFSKTNVLHEYVIKKNNLLDNKRVNRDIVRLTVAPDWEALTKDFNREDWDFKVDEPSSLPRWFKEEENWVKKVVFERILELYNDYFLFGDYYDALPKESVVAVYAEVGVLEGYQHIEKLLGKIKVMKDDSSVEKMFGSSYIKEMLNNASVSVMQDNSRINVMHDLARVGTMRDQSKISLLQGFAQVKEMLNHAKISELKQSAIVREMYNQAQIFKMHNSTLVQAMFDRSKIRKMHDQSLAIRKSEESQIKKKSDNAVVVDRTQ